jgi:GR25 family glycosyltransferase involved in LPS biosynthesis
MQLFILACLLAFILLLRTKESYRDATVVPIWVISLDKREDRRREMRARLPNTSLQFFSAVDGAKLKTHPTLTRGEYGCFQSHAKLWDRIAKGPHETVLVLEDDAVISMDIIQKALCMVSGKKYDAFVLGVNYITNFSLVRDEMGAATGIVIPRDPSLYGMHAVLYTREGARRLSAAIQREGMRVPSDTFLARQPGVLVAHPPLVLPSRIHDSDTQKNT